MEGDMQRTIKIFCLLALPCALSLLSVQAAAQTPTQGRTLPKPTQTAPRIVAIEKYTDELDAYAKQNPQARRFFVNTAAAAGGWQEVGSEQETKDKASAVVWFRKEK